MATKIKKIKLFNYKRFKEYEMTPNEKMNILIGDNETGKSTIIEAIDIVLGGNVRKVEKIGAEKLLNVSAKEDFFRSTKQFEDLPEIIIEVYLDGNLGIEMNGKNNTDRIVADGIRMKYVPNPDYEQEIIDSINAEEDFFPFDYYYVSFSTFADRGYSGYKKKVKNILIDSSRLNSDYATSDFIRRMYDHYTESNIKERVVHKSNYRQLKNEFEKDNLKGLNSRIPEEVNYSFGFKSSDVSNFGEELMIYDRAVALDSKGSGSQIFIKVDFVLSNSGENVDIILIEEPENHLSPVKLRALIEKICSSNNGQMFVSTHSSYISTRLELKNVFILQGEDTKKPLALKDLEEDTGKYFMKTPPTSIVEFALANRIVLVEGPAEYMLFDSFYRKITGKRMEEEDVQILDVRGLSFKRYLEIARITGARVAIVTDNDSDYQLHCVKKYEKYEDCDNIGVFYETDNEMRTFEVVLESANKELCRELFGGSAIEYMLHNKTEVAYELMSKCNVNVPDYIKRAIEWIRL